MSHRNCEICGIQEKRCSGKIFFARFPILEHICKQWVKVVGKEDLVHLPIEKLHDLRYVCGKHFEKRHFTKTQTRLKKNAVPTLHLTMPLLPDELLEGFPLHMEGKNQAAEYQHVRKVHTDHSYCSELRPGAKPVQQLERIPQGAPARLPTDDAVRLPRADDSVRLQETSDSVWSLEADDHVDADTFDYDDAPPSPEPEIAAAVQDQKPQEEKVFSWQKTELIETDDTEVLTPEPVSDNPTLRDDPVTLSSFCEKPESPSVPCEPAAAPAPEGVENLCQVCGAVENGYYYLCVSCGAGALCGACAATLTHELHFVLRAPTTASKEQTQSIIAVLRQQLENENLLRLYETEDNEMKVEVKQELEEFPILHYSPEPEPDPLSDLDPLARLSEALVNPDTEVPQEQMEVTVTKGLTEDTDRLVSETMATDVDVEFVRETIDHHQFKRPRLMEHSQSIKPATKNVQLPLLNHPNVKGSQTMISNPAGSKTVLRSKQDIIRTSVGRNRQFKLNINQ